MKTEALDAAMGSSYTPEELEAFRDKALRYARQDVHEVGDGVPLQAMVDSLTNHLRYQLYEGPEGGPQGTVARLAGLAEGLLADRLRQESATGVELTPLYDLICAAYEPNRPCPLVTPWDDTELETFLVFGSYRPGDWRRVLSWVSAGHADALLYDLVAALEALGCCWTTSLEFTYRWVAGRFTWEALPDYPRCAARTIYAELLRLHLVSRPSYDLDFEGVTRLVRWDRARRSAPQPAVALVPQT